MQWEIVILVIFFILIIPLTFNVKLSFNVIRNYGELNIVLFFIPIYKQKLKIDNGFIKFIKNPQKIKKIKLKFSKSDIEKTNNNFALVLNSQIIKRLSISTRFGIKDNPFYTALISGFYNMFLGIFFSINTAKLNILETQSNFKTYYRCTYLKSILNIKLNCSLYQILSLLIQFKVGVKTDEFY